MVITLGRNDNIMTILTQLYSNSNQEALEKLKQVKSRMKSVATQVTPQFDDIEAEITCLLLMYAKPQQIREFLSYYGWSTMYLLNTIDLGLLTGSRVHSYGFHQHNHQITTKFPALLDQLTVTYGDVVTQFPSMLESETDFLFIDSNHDQEFAQQYINQLLVPLLDKLKKNNKKIFVVVHDVFHAMYETNYEFSAESKMLLQFLRQKGISYFSPQNFSNKKKIAELRAQSGLDQEQVNSYTTNPAIFFILG